MKKRFINILTAVLVIIIFICIYKITDKNYEYYKADKSYEEVRNVKNSIKKTSLSDINSDYRFWINIPGTSIDYPVVQTSDNNFYLKNDFYKNKSINGAIFLDKSNKISSDENLIIYGHNMRNGSMFQDLTNFKDKDFFHKGIVKISKENKQYTYEIFSVFTEKSSNVQLKTNFKNKEQFNLYINDLIKKSIYKKNIDSKNITKIITLYTCSYDFEEARTIVCAALAEELL